MDDQGTLAPSDSASSILVPRYATGSSDGFDSTFRTSSRNWFEI